MKKMIGLAGLITVILGLSFCKKSEKKAVVGKNFPTESITPKGTNWVIDPAKSDDFDNFNAAKWSAAPLWYYGGVTGDFAYKTANTEVNGGKAQLIAKKEVHNNIADPSFQRQYTAGCLKSKFEVGGDSYIEVRAKMINALQMFVRQSGLAMIRYWKRTPILRLICRKPRMLIINPIY